MKKKLFYSGCIVLSIAITSTLFFYNNKENKFTSLRKAHKEFLQNSPFKETLKLSKAERKALGLTPNKYYEREWELTMNPATGLPEPQKVLDLQKNLRNDNTAYRNPGDASDNSWVERGPNNVGGRTRAVLFDPNDGTNETVYAAGVSGGLWVNTNISNASSTWTQVSGVPSNMNVSCITVDPRNSDIWYLGTGEQYTAGAAVGNGVYKSTDGGTNWVNVPVQLAGIGDLTGGAEYLAGIYFINDIIAWDNGSSTEVFIGVGGNRYGSTTAAAQNPNNYLGLQSAGIYRTTDNGSNWSRIESTNMEFDVSGYTFYYIPNDFEIDLNNKLWMGTIKTTNFSNTGGGRIYSSTDGAIWTEAAASPLTDANRVEIAVSATTTNKIYALVQGDGTAPAHIYATTDGFATAPTELALPDDADTGIPSNDFTRGQAFYDLVIEVDPTNDDIVYVGGIDLFRSTQGINTDVTTEWKQISKWSNNNNLAALTCSIVHADQHAFTFHPTDSNIAVLGNDGGVYYASSLSTSETTDVIGARNTDYNTVQFYNGAIAPGSFSADDYLLAGAQDNGTQYIEAGNPSGPDSAIRVKSGDGAYSFIDQVGADYYIANYIANNSITLYNYSLGALRTINADENNDGDFINPGDLDSNLDILYHNGSNGSNYRIYRYSDLLTIPAAGTATKTTLTDGLLTDSPTAFAVSPHTTTSTTMLVGASDSKVLLLTNADTAPVWTDITGTSFIGSVSDVEFGATENDMLVTFHNYGVTSIWYSDDGGTSWSSKEGNLPDIPVKCILQNPLEPNEVIIGTELGVWATTSFGGTPVWIQSYNGMSDVKVTDLELRSSDNTVLATTFGRGMFTGSFTTSAFTANFTADKTNINNAETVSFTDVSLGTPISWTWTFSPTTVTYQNGTDTNSQNPQVKFDVAGNYTVTLLTGDGSSTDTETKTNYISVSTAAYCDSEYPDGLVGTRTVFLEKDSDMSTVINNDTGATLSPNGYGDYTSTVYDLNAGETYNLDVTTYTFSSNTMHCQVYIDWNQDYVFSESEMYDLGDTDVDFGVLSTSIVVPNDAVTGNTRMRINNEFGGNPGACTVDHVQSYGETEDYTLNIVNTLGLKDFTSTYGLKVYPTLTNGNINIYSSIGVQDVQLEVYNINGKILYTERTNLISGQQKELKFDNLSTGVYYMSFKTQGARETIKFVKK